MKIYQISGSDLPLERGSRSKRKAGGEYITWKGECR
jgi:hypothetical protein